MRRGVAIVVVVLAAVAVGWWWRSSSSRSRTAGSPTRTDAGVARDVPVATRDVPADARTGPAPRPADAAPRTAAEEAEIGAGLSDAHAHLQDLVAPCLTGAAVSDAAVIQFRYVLVVAGGTAHTADALVTEATEPIVEIVPCITEAVGNASWPTALPDLEMPVEDRLVVSELR